MPLAWGARISQEARARLLAIAQGGGFDPSWLSAAIQFESRWNPAAVNPGSGATGLIQFMPSTARKLGATVEQLATMSAEEQLNFVAAYFASFAHRLPTVEDCYMAILWPAAVGLPNDAPLFSKDDANAKAYFANKGLDLNQDGTVTKAEASARVVQLLADGLSAPNASADDSVAAVPTPDVAAVSPVAPGGKPMGTLLVPLLLSVVGKFLNPTVAQDVTSLATKDGGQSAAAQNLITTLLGAVASAAGVTPAAVKADDAVAVKATNVVLSDSAKLQAVEDAAAAHLDAVKPFIAQLAVYDQMRFDAENKGKQVVSSIAIAEHVAGLWDMTKWLVVSLLLMLWGIAWGLLGAIIFLATQAKPDPTALAALIGLAGPIWTGAIVATVIAIVAYRFDGSKESHASAEAQRAMERFREETGKAGGTA